MRIKLSLLYLFILFSISGTAQTVWENPEKEVYRFLQRQAQKGTIDLNDIVQPISRKQIADKLAALESSGKLSPTEQKELAFYHQEYSEFDDYTDSLSLLKKDPAGRLRFLSVKTPGFTLRGDPLITLETIQGNGRSVFRKGNGLQFWGHAGARIGFQASFQDITESGTGIDSIRAFTPETGVVRTEGKNNKRLNYSDLRGHISYSWNNGSISFGKDQLLIGYGEYGRPILSNKAPSYPYIRLDYQPLKWLYFQYAHGWLQSGIIDSARTYGTGNTVYGGQRELFVQKFFATHSLNFLPVRGLSITLGESVVYSDKLNVGYLIPIMFFKAYDHYSSRYNISAGSNGQFYLQASSRNHIPKTQLYASVFIDEIRLSEVLNNQKSRNQIGFTLGASYTDLLPYLTIGTEYSRINPFVYQNLQPAQTYTTQKYSLGDWMGNNADRWLGYLSYTPIAKLKLRLQQMRVRRGPQYSIEDQYFQEPQPSFLTSTILDLTETQFTASYEWLNGLSIQGSFSNTGISNYALGLEQHYTTFRLGVRLGF